MKHSFVTIAIPIDDSRVEPVNRALREMGNPAIEAVRDQLREDQLIHFVSMSAVSADGNPRAHLLIEASSDVDPDRTVQLLVDRLERWLQPAAAAAGLPAGDLTNLLKRSRITTGVGLSNAAGLDHTGTPGMTVKRIRAEFKLARRVRDLFDANSDRGDAKSVLEQIRADLRKDGEYAHLLTPEPCPFLREGSNASLLSKAFPLALGAVRTYFWPLILAGVVLSALAGWAGWRTGGPVTGVLAAIVGLALTLLALLVAAGLIYAGLRRRENSDVPNNSLPNEEVLTAVIADENKAMQNHMTGVSRMKPGRLRRLMLKLAFFVIGRLAGSFRPGYLTDIGTIHFARWVLLPGSDQLIFFSNYGGSWESYLEDFITKAHSGLTGIWSNTEGFPKASNLFFEGATDGEPFKRWARRQQRPTAFWYSAYPGLTTDRIRSNAAIRQGLAAASTEDESKAWLANLGSRIPPVTQLDSPEIQTILFGGLKRHPHATCLLLALPSSPDDARAWLSRVKGEISFGDRPDPRRVTQLALSATGLRRLGLREDQLASFPYAFRMGMAGKVRSNILKDTGDDKPERWIWGSGGNEVDAALLIYTPDPALLEEALGKEMTALRALGGRVVHEVRLRTLGEKAQRQGVGRRNQEFEAFGFADGVSQPVIKGTRRWTKATDRLHEVEPGEFLLGYPDNRGGRPLSPTVRSEDDPHNLLSVLNPAYARAHYPCFDSSGANSDRDLGLNGSYLVIRQLAQDVAAFEASVAQAADQCADHPGMPPGLDDPTRRREWVAAKMVGRWRDGTSLVRYPHRPGTGWDGQLDAEPDNGFLLGAEDPVGHRCPFGSHIRRANPRESMEPGSMEQLAITNRHRILRIGRRYDGYTREDGSAETEGLFFMCLNGDIERQFEFIQQTWAFAMQFLGVENEVDAILGRGSQKDDARERKTARLTIPTPYGPIYVRDLKDVVQVRGGGYFFLPSRSAVAWLSS